jgi:tetratricopeptide (TPR) repeat protein
VSRDVGDRIRRLRAQRGVSQAQLAADVRRSGSYLSLIESGRRPAPASVLELIAKRLGCTSDYLLRGEGGSADDSLDLDLRFAEIALRNGDSQAADERFTAIANSAQAQQSPRLRLGACWGLARTREAQGRLEEAIEGYEGLLAEPQLSGLLRHVTIETALCRAYSECGDLNRAVDVGEAALRQIEDHDETLLSEESVALASTLVGCYFERGDLTRAHSLARTALARAEKGGSPLARAAALWNGGLVAEARGDMHTARTYLQRAMALYSESDNLRAVALLKIASAWLMLRQPEPTLTEAEALLDSALTDLPEVGTAVDIAYGETELARCRLLSGDWQAAIRLAETCLERLGEKPRLERAETRLVLGHALLESGDATAAVACYSAAAVELRGAGAQRQAASAWRELAESLIQLGRADEALDAYREAADAAGVTKAPERAKQLHATNRRA